VFGWFKGLSIWRFNWGFVWGHLDGLIVYSFESFFLKAPFFVFPPLGVYLRELGWFDVYFFIVYCLFFYLWVSNHMLNHMQLNQSNKKISFCFTLSSPPLISFEVRNKTMPVYDSNKILKLYVYWLLISLLLYWT